MDKLSFNFSGQIWKQPEIEFKNDKLINVDDLEDNSYPLLIMT